MFKAKWESFLRELFKRVRTVPKEVVENRVRVVPKRVAQNRVKRSTIVICSGVRVALN